MTKAVVATWGLGLGVMVLASSAQAREPASSKAEVAQCISASESVQDARRQGKLLKARDAVAGCMDVKCPAMIRTDCDDYSRKIETALPSVLLRVVDRAGADVPRAALTVDGTPVALDGRALDLDPGSHKISAAAEGFAGETTEVVVQEGVKNRTVELHLTAKSVVAAAGAAADALASPTRKPSRSPSTGTWIGTGALGVTAVAALSIFAGMGLSGNGRYGELEDTCGGRCVKADVDALRTRYLVADVSLVVGVVAAVAAGAVLVFGPRKADATETHTASR